MATTRDSAGGGSGLGGGSGVLRRKPVEQIASEHEGELSRSLGLWQLTAIGVGGIIGAGIFALAGAVAHETAGPAGLVSFLIARGGRAGAAPSYPGVARKVPEGRFPHTHRPPGVGR